MNTLLKVNSSVQADNSVTRKLVEQLTNALVTRNTKIIDRNLSDDTPLLTPEMVAAFYTLPSDRTEAQEKLVTFSDELVAELQEADIIVIGQPIYNFSVPGTLKAYYDLIARAGVTFKYTENGPQGLLKNKKVYVVVASGGTGFKSEEDFASGYTEQFLGFLGITDVSFIVADQLTIKGSDQIANAESKIKSITKASVS